MSAPHDNSEGFAITAEMRQHQLKLNIMKSTDSWPRLVHVEWKQSENKKRYWTNKKSQQVGENEEMESLA
eukprot:15897283-Heterocapsa_arctica.AAC.1